MPSVSLLASILSAGFPLPQQAAVRTLEYPRTQTCEVLAEAYRVASESKVPVWPADLTASFERFDIAKTTPDYLERLGLNAAEVADLKTSTDPFRVGAYRPSCGGIPPTSTKLDDEGHKLTASFSYPIYSADGQLALVDVSFQEPGFGYGSLCAVRHEGGRWTARCQMSWIS
jgi:hypothetical protein